MNQETFALIVGSVLRSLIAVVAGWLAAHGMLQSGTVEEWVAAVTLAVIGLLWSLIQKVTERKKLNTAMAMPAGVTENEVKAKIAAGKGEGL